MSELKLTPAQTLLRESLIVRINQGAKAIADGDQAGTSNAVEQDPILIYSAVVAQFLTDDTSTDDLSKLIHIGSLVVARQAKANHIASVAIGERDKFQSDLNELLETPSTEIEEAEINEIK